MSDPNDVLWYDDQTRHAKVPHSVRVMCGGQIVATVHASYDLTNVPDEYLERCLYLLTQHRSRIGVSLPSAEQIQDYNERHAEVQEWKALPFWKRWRTARPEY